MCTKNIFRAQTSQPMSNSVHEIPFSCTNFAAYEQLCARNTLFVHKLRSKQTTLCTKHPFRAQTHTLQRNLETLQRNLETLPFCQTKLFGKLFER